MSIGLARLIGRPESSQQLGPGGVQGAVVVEAEAVDYAQASLGSFGIGDGDGTFG